MDLDDTTIVRFVLLLYTRALWHGHHASLTIIEVYTQR